MFINMITMGMMHMTVMKVIAMVIVFDCCMATIAAMFMRVLSMRIATHLILL